MRSISQNKGVNKEFFSYTGVSGIGLLAIVLG